MYLFRRPTSAAPSKEQPSAAPTKEQQRADMLKRMGVENPETRNMNRNVMLSQIETFDRGRLKPLVDEQRYMVSPHDDVRNFMANSRGMGEQALSDHHPMVRPVFKDIQQRDAFHQLAQQELSGQVVNSPRYKTFEQLAQWSHPDQAMMDFKGVDTKRSHPIVFVQGHGSPGDTSMYSNTNQAKSAKSVATMLDQMGLPKVSQVRVNSCFSGTEHDLSALPDVRKRFQNQTIEQSAGHWSKTFAGTLEHELNQTSYKGRYEAHKAEVDQIMKRPLGTWGQIKAFFNPNNLTEQRKAAIDTVSARHNRVVGYMGPTTQGSVQATSRSPLGKLSTTTHTAVVFGPDSAPSYYKHGDVSRTGPSVREKK